MTGFPQAPLCSSNGLLRRHGRVGSFISSYSPHEPPLHLAVLPFLNGCISFTQRINVLSVKSKAITQLTSHVGSIHCLLIQLQVIVWPHELVKSSVTLFSQDNNPLLSTETLKTYNKTVKQSKQSIAASDFEQFVP